MQVQVAEIRLAQRIDAHLWGFGGDTWQRNCGNRREAEQRGRLKAAHYQSPPNATVIASPFTPPEASLHRNAITSATSRGSRTRFCG